MSLAQGRPAGATAAYVAPFVIYVAMIALPLPPEILFPVRFVIVLAVILWLSLPYLSLKPSHTLASAAVGIAVFYTVVSRDNLDQEYAAHRQRFLAEQGYSYTIVDSDDLISEG